MRRIVILMVSAAALACGGSDSKDQGPTLPTGTIGGAAFTTVEARVVTAATPDATPCALADLGTVGLSGMKLDLAGYANVCGDYAQCRGHANAQSVTLIFAQMNPGLTGSLQAPPLTPGTYPVQQSPRLPDTTTRPGTLLVTYAESLKTGATCQGNGTTPGTLLPGASNSTTGSLVINSVSTTEIKGSVDITFADGGRIQGPFTAAVCPGVPLDLCALATAATSGSAVQFCAGQPMCQ